MLVCGGEMGEVNVNCGFCSFWSVIYHLHECDGRMDRYDVNIGRCRSTCMLIYEYVFLLFFMYRCVRE